MKKRQNRTKKVLFTPKQNEQNKKYISKCLYTYFKNYVKNYCKKSYKII